jgi:hypothetical protein
MSDVLRYPELWLLERCCTHDACWLPLALLPDTEKSGKSGYSEYWNSPPHGRSGRELSEVMWDLFRRDEIEFRLLGDSADELFVPRYAEDIHSRMNAEVEECRSSKSFWRSNHHCFRVTSIGVALWESFAIPDWDRFRGDFDGKLWKPGETNWSQSATTEAFAREVLDVYGSDPFEPTTLFWETATVATHRPWIPFPGKELPFGVTVSVRVTEVGQRSFTADESLSARPLFAEHRRRFGEICRRWYQNGTHNHPQRPSPQPDDTENSG